MADELQKVRDDLKSERLTRLKALGTDVQTRKESVILDIMLFRLDDLLEKVESAHLEQLKDWSRRRGARRQGRRHSAQRRRWGRHPRRTSVKKASIFSSIDREVSE